VNLEKNLSNKRALTGYSSASVVENIQSLQDKYEKQLKSLDEKLIIEKEMNQKLIMELERQQTIPQINPIEEEMQLLIDDLFEQHLMNTKTILDLQMMLDEQELKYKQELEKKRQQKEDAKIRLHEALDYLKTLPLTTSGDEKEQNK